MDKIVPSTFLPGVNVSAGDKTVVVQPQDVQINLKPGTFVLLETIANSDLAENSLVTLNIQTQEGQFPLVIKAQTALPINVAEGELQQYNAKVLKDGSLQLFPIKNNTSSPNIPSSQQPIQSNIGTLGRINEAVFQPLKVVSIIDNMIKNIELSTSLKQQIISSLPAADIQVAIKNLDDAPFSDTILQPIKNILAQMSGASNHPQQINELQQQLEQEIFSLVGKSFSAKVALQPNPANTMVLDSSLGKILSETTFKLAPQTPLHMEVSEIKVSQVFEETSLLKSAIESMAKLFTKEHLGTIDTRAILQSIRNGDNQSSNFIKNITSLLAEAKFQETVSLILQKLPGIKGNILQNLYSFYKAANSGEAIDWLGKETTSQILNSAKGAEALGIAEAAVSSVVKETPLWRIIEIPFFEGSRIVPLQISVKKDRDEQEKKKNSKSGLRFIIETEFSKLGAVQFDGLSVAAERRLDLVIRTSQKMEEDFCLAIINLFKKSLHDLEYTGSIKINQRETFIRVDKDPQILLDGVYI